MQIPAYWIKAIIRKPSIAKWYFHWRNSLNGKRTPLDDELPWITYEAIDWFFHFLTKEMILFEWGSGGSTAFFSPRVKQVITIEHDLIWYHDVTNALTKKECKNSLLSLVEPAIDVNINSWYTSTDASNLGKSFESYIKAIDKYPDNFFDVVVVDGRARPGCIRQALPKVKHNGYLVLDNSDRAEYATGINLLTGWRESIFAGPAPYADFPISTTAWQRV